MTVQTSAGCALLIGTTSANAASDTYLPVGEITNIPEFGRVYQEITHNSVGDRSTKKFKGSYNEGSITITLGRDISDAGQAAMVAARDSDADFNFKVTLNDAPSTGASPKPTTYLFKAKVMSFTTNIGGPNQIVGASAMIGISGAITETAASAT
ncbi:hypothetical protein OKC48_20645 [Methylorubrum extorquens]|uniref:hypothetical protein n=1 Tax=Methylorubrum extorquens TaxID=408 RepID=UPI0022387310|nr:hypothetical protein [Methylorubrum extorquens]UYW25657.1 hypothetical protein OKC48_20645 [Methylorubrum extorquens]